MIFHVIVGATGVSKQKVKETVWEYVREPVRETKLVDKNKTAWAS